MPVDPTSALNDEQKQRLLSAASQLAEARNWCQLCKQTGMDVAEYDRQIDQLTQLVNGMIRTFVNPRRRGG